jgi:DNA recombination protein RmuC
MVPTAIFLAALAVAVVLAWLITKLLYGQKLLVAKAELKNTLSQTDELKQKQEGLKEELKNSAQEASELKQQNSGLLTRLEEKEKNFKEQIENLNKVKEQMKLEFENLAQKILEEKGSKFSEQSKEQLNHLISPLQVQIADFKKKVEDVYVDEKTQRVSLKNEIDKMHSAYETMSREADNLVHALKADTKMQGDWGEINLRRILDFTGLTEGVNYFVQPNYKNEAGENLRPDIVVNLPNEKQIILDSKVSLTAYERYVNATEEAEKLAGLKEHIKSLRKHVTELSDKKYEDLQGINTLDFVLMFVPVEAAYFAAIEEDKELYRFASGKKVLPVCPSTLLITMQLVVSLWRWDKQNRFAREISDQGAKLLEKFAGFLENMDKIQSSLNKSQEAFELAQRQLYKGPGNLISHAEKLTKLGVKVSSKTHDKLLEYIELGETATQIASQENGTPETSGGTPDDEDN